MTNLETVVRPFQTNNVAPAQRYVNAGVAAVPNVRLQVGRGGQGKTMNGSFSHSASFYSVNQIQERTQVA